MELMSSALAKEIEAISANPNAEGNSYLTADIHVGGKTLRVMKVLQLDQLRDYLDSYSDSTTVRVVVGAGMYAYHIYPNLAKLEITLYSTPLTGVSGQRVMSKKIQSERFMATVLNPEPMNFTSNSKSMPSEFTLDHERLMELDIQLVNKAVEQFRLIEVGGVYRKTTPGAVVQLALTAYSKNVETDGGNVPLGVQMIPAVNTKEREQVVVPHGTKLVDLPQFLHEKCGGVYPTGFAYYYQNDYWYVFPPYDNKRFDQSAKTLTLIRIPARQFPNVERTYRRNGNNLVVMATGEASVDNKSETALLNQGNGARFADADQFMQGFAGVEDNKAMASRGATNNEFTTLKRANGNNNVRMSSQRITANPMVEYSRLAARDGTEMQVVWNNSDPSLIFPGMQAKILYLEGDKIKHVYATVLGVQNSTSLVGQGITSTRHDTTTAIRLFAQREMNA